MEVISDAWLDECTRDMAALELALLRRGVEGRGVDHVRCSCCHRTPLVGERVYLADNGPVLCELCRAGRPAARLQTRVVRGPNFGRAIRIVDQRAA